MSESLKPCPFCGGVMVCIVTDHVAAGHGCYVKEYYVDCVGCHSRTDSFDTYGDTDEEARAKAITAWNMRVSQ